MLKIMQSVHQAAIENTKAINLGNTYILIPFLARITNGRLLCTAHSAPARASKSFCCVISWKINVYTRVQVATHIK